MNILHEKICEKYNIVHSELDSDGTNPIYIRIELSNGHVLRVELKLYGVDDVYTIVEEACSNYYLMENRKEKLRKIRK